MEPVFNERKLRAWLEPLSRRQRAAFALACCERLYPSLTALHGETGAGDPDGLRRVLDAAWAFLDGRDLAADLPALAGQCRCAAPAGEPPGSPHAGPAASAALAASLLLEVIGTGSLDKAIEAAAAASEAAESWAQCDLELAPDAPDADQRIAAHPLVQQELRHQREDIRLLHRTSLEQPGSAAELRRRWSDRATATRSP